MTFMQRCNNMLPVSQVDQQWQVADICNGDIIFNPEEISEVINTVLGVPDRC